MREKYSVHVPIALERIAKGRRGELTIMPDSFWLAISKNCNLRCIGCDDAVHGFTKDYLSPDEVRAILSVEGNRFNQIDLTSAEAMLHPQLCDVIDVCKEVQPQARILVISNGTVPVKGRYRDALLKIDDLGLSIDGSTKETFERIRVGSNFEAFLRNTRDVMQIRAETGHPRSVKFAFTACALNLHELSGVIELAADLKLSGVFAQPMEMKLKQIVEQIGHLHLNSMNSEQRTQLVDNAREEAKRLGVTFHFSPGLYPVEASAKIGTVNSPAETDHLEATNFADADAEAEYHVRMCHYPWTDAPGIMRNGDGLGVILCCYMPQYVWGALEDRYRFGDIKGRSVKEIFNSPQYWQFREDLLLGKTRKFCGQCSAAKTHSPKRKQIIAI